MMQEKKLREAPPVTPQRVSPEERRQREIQDRRYAILDKVAAGDIDYVQAMLDDAIQGMGIDQGLEFMEEEGLSGKILDVCGIVYLSHPATPFYTLAELQKHIDQFTGYLKNNKGSCSLLIGKPQHDFSASPWLHNKLSHLFYIPPQYKQGFYNFEGITQQHVDLYNDGWRCSKLRQNLLKLKIEVLIALYNAIVDRDSEGLYESCIRLIPEYLTHEQLKYCLEIGAARAANYGFPLLGGLVSLLEVASHVTMELLSPTYSEIRQPFLELIGDDAGLMEHRASKMQTCFYFPLIKAGKRKEMETLLCRFRKLLGQRKSLVTKNLEASTQQAWKDVAEKYSGTDSAPDTQTQKIIADVTKAIKSEMLRDKPEPARYQLTFRGNAWDVVFENEEFCITDLDGMHYLSGLFYNARVPLSPDVLIKLREKTRTRGKILKTNILDRDRGFETKALYDFRYIKELVRERDALRAKPGDEKAGCEEAEITKILNAVGVNQGITLENVGIPLAKYRQQKVPTSMDFNRVKQALYRTYKHIKRLKSHKLYQHLKACVKPQSPTFIYLPEPPHVAWNITQKIPK